MKRIIVTLIFCIIGLAAQADRMYAHKAWTVDLNRGEDGLWCAAQTINATGDYFGVGLWRDGSVTIYSEFWGANFGPTHRFQPVMDIDYQRWTLLNTQRFGNGMMSWVGGANLRGLLSDLQRGRYVAFKRNDGGNYATFSLAGSRRAIDALRECGHYIGWRR